MVETEKKRTFKTTLTIGAAKSAGWELTDLLDLNKLDLEGLKKFPIKLTWEFMIRFANSMINEPEFYLNDNTSLVECMNVLKESLSNAFLGLDSLKS